jgi:hypothetical protein
MTPQEIEAEVQRLAGKGLEAAAIYLAGRLKEVLNVPAPRKLVTAGPKSRWVPPGTRYFVATTPATPGAPPRKLSGAMQQRTTYQKVSDNLFRVGTWGLPYPATHEYGAHPWLMVTVQAELPNLARIIGEAT